MKVLGRKVLAMLLTLAMVLGCGAMAFADETAEPVVGDGINEYSVMIDGEFVVFPDAAPQNVDGRIMVPFRAIFEKLGADVDFDNDTRTVTAVMGGKTISFPIGGKEILIEEEGMESKTLAMDVVPFIDAKTGRTYVPTRFISEALGLSVGWDADQKTAVVIDPAPIFAGANEDFTIISKLFDASGVDMEQVYKTTGDFAVKGSMDLNLLEMLMTGEIPEGDAGMLNISMDGSMDAMQKGYDLDGSMKMPFKMSTTAEGQEVSMEMDMDIDMKMDGEAMVIYMKSSMFTEMMGVDENTWLAMDIEDAYGTAGMDVSAIMDLAENMDLEALLTESIAASADTFTTYTYESTVMGYNMIKTYLGDDAFVKTSAGGYDVYTNTIKNEDMGLDGKIVLRTKADKLADFDISFAINIEDFLSGSLKMAGSDTKAEFALTFSIPEAVELEMTVNSVMKPASGTVDVKLPADAKVLDYMETLESMMESGM